MGNSLLDSLMSAAGPQVVNALASRFGEPNANIQKGLQTGAAALLGGLVKKSGDTDFLGNLMGMLKSANEGNVLSSLSGLAEGKTNGALGDLGSKLLSSVLGNQQEGIASAIGQSAGLKPSSASGLLSVAGPMLLGVLGQRVKQNGLNISSLGSLLTSEAGQLTKFLPGGVANLMGGLSGLAGVGAVSASPSWVKPVLIVAAVLAGLYFLKGNKTTYPKPQAMLESTTPSVAQAVTSLFESNLESFIKDASKPVDKTTWFDFDALVFETGKAALEPSSHAQLDNVAKILQTYPAVHLKIGGYTDNQGQAANNLKLSTARANTVKTELVQRGISADRLTAEGYGDQHPVGDNATEEGRAKNRRIAVRVTAK